MLDRPQGPLFRRGEGRIDEGFGEIDLAAVAQIFGETLQEPVQPAAALPLLKAPMARLIRWVARRQVVPRGPSAQYPEHAVQHGARIGPRTAPTIGTSLRPKERLEHGPLLVSEVHAVEYDGQGTSVHTPAWGFMR